MFTRRTDCRFNSTQPLKITIVQGAFFPVPPIEGGAVEKIWHSLGLMLAARGLIVTHISKKTTGQADNEHKNGVIRKRVHGYARPRSSLLAILLDALYSIRVWLALPDADILITNTLFLPVLPHRGRKGKCYVSVHRFPRTQYRFYNSAARFQCVSTVVAEALKLKYPAASGRVKVISNFIDAYETEYDFSKMASKSESRILLYSGRIHPEKGVHLLVEAFLRCPEAIDRGWTLNIIGPHLERGGGGGEPYMKTLRLLASGMETKVRFLEPEYDRTRLSDRYRQSTILVYPSVAGKGEALPLAPLEAMAFATPILVSELDCFNDYFSDGENGWRVDLSSSQPIKALAEIIEKACLDCETQFAHFSLNALETAKRFHIDNIVEIFIDDFGQLVNAT